jgi:hypothetical protein
MVVLTSDRGGLEVSNASPFREGGALQAAGDFTWFEGPVDHCVANSGQGTFSAVIVEWL